MVGLTGGSLRGGRGWVIQPGYSSPARPAFRGAAPSSPAHPQPPCYRPLTHRKGKGNAGSVFNRRNTRVASAPTRVGRCRGDTRSPVTYNQGCSHPSNRVCHISERSGDAPELIPRVFGVGERWCGSVLENYGEKGKIERKFERGGEVGGGMNGWS